MATQLSLTQIVHRQARNGADQPCLVHGSRATSAGVFADDVARLAGGLQGAGLLPGGCVAILALSSDRYVEAVFATMWAGGAVCPLNVRWTADDLVAALTDCRAGIVITDAAMAPMVASIRTRLGLVRSVVALDGAIDLAPGGTTGDTATWEELLAGPAVDDAGRGGDDVAMILFTGGTTGRSKGVLLTHTNLMAASLGMLAAGCGTGPVYLHAPPLFHVAGVQMMLGHFLRATGTHVILPAFAPATVLSALDAHRVTDVMLVPTMLQMVLADPRLVATDLSGLERIFFGAAPMTATLLQAARDAIPGVGFVQGYGMTETGLTIMLAPWYYSPHGLAEGRTGSIGRSLPTAEVVIRDPTGQEVPRGSVGELTVRSPSVMLGYLGRPEETAATVRDGWLYSGDGACMDADGFIHLADRIKDMIITGGENVYSTEVEAVLVTHPAVTSAAVIGVPHPTWGEQVHAVVTLAAGTTLTAEDLIAHCGHLLAGYKCPRSVEVRSALPLSPAGKVLKATLRAEQRARTQPVMG